MIQVKKQSRNYKKQTKQMTKKMVNQSTKKMRVMKMIAKMKTKVQMAKVTTLMKKMEKVTKMGQMTMVKMMRKKMHKATDDLKRKKFIIHNQKCVLNNFSFTTKCTKSRYFVLGSKHLNAIGFSYLFTSNYQTLESSNAT